MTELPRRWFQFADEDLILARAALKEGIPNQACFHAQQGVEKALKGFLRSKQRSVPRSHSLEELLALCMALDRTFSKLKGCCVTLDQYYIPTRYPDAFPGSSSKGLPTERDAEKAVKLLRETLSWIRKKMA